MGNSTASVSSPVRGGVTVYRAVSGDELDPRDGSVVMLNVYDLNATWLSANNILKEVLQIGGAFHAGVEVHGMEFTYGCDGVTDNFPKCHDVHIYRQTVIMGRTDHSPESVQATIDERLVPAWKGDEYNMLNHNCVSFCRYLCYLLVGLPIPGWVDRLAKLASSNGMDKIIENVLNMRPDSTDSVDSVPPSPSNGGRIAPRYSMDMLEPITDGSPFSFGPPSPIDTAKDMASPGSSPTNPAMLVPRGISVVSGISATSARSRR
mmetsp:Transcript_66417/g.122699  ORF Transcript_66417/g.122699 Transcript_66417/m.122699 type:complete len:263 (-) Transcript_66417:43-831(-)